MHPSTFNTVRALLLVGSSLLATGCATVGPKYREPIQARVAVANVDPRLLTPNAPETRWWRAFEDSQLDALVDRALAGNTDVRVAIARVKEARALFRDVELDRFPRVTADATYSRSDEQVPGFGPGRVDLEQADIGFDAAWEVDLFGRVRHQVESARAEAQASAADLRDVQVSVVAEVARNYLQLRGAQARRAVAEANAAAQRETLRLTQVRRGIGVGDPVDLQSAKARLNATEATIPVLVTAEAQAGHRIAVLLGERPGTLDAELAAPKEPPKPFIKPLPVGDVSVFLRQRPDVAAAERRLAAETARTGVATADLFPRVRLTGFIGLLSGDVSGLFKGGSQAWTVSPQVTWPALDLGGARARLRAQQARGEGSLAQYDAVVLRAIEDLQNATVAYRQRQSQVVSLAGQVDASRAAAELARVRYREGSIDFLRVLDAERTRLQAEDALTEAQTAANLDVVAIYKALGGPV